MNEMSFASGKKQAIFVPYKQIQCNCNLTHPNIKWMVHHWRIAGAYIRHSPVQILSFSCSVWVMYLKSVNIVQILLLLGCAL